MYIITIPSHPKLYRILSLFYVTSTVSLSSPKTVHTGKLSLQSVVNLKSNNFVHIQYYYLVLLLNISQINMQTQYLFFPSFISHNMMPSMSIQIERNTNILFFLLLHSIPLSNFLLLLFRIHVLKNVN